MPSDGVGSLPHTRKATPIKRCALACQQEGGPSVEACRPWANGDSAREGPLMKVVTIAGGGLAGSEAAWQLAARGFRVNLYEMRPARSTPAHKTDRLAELVCSNSLKSNTPGAAAWLLKEELRRAGSLLIKLAGECAVPGGAALVVDRERFSESVTQALGEHPLVTVRREELGEIPSDGLVLIATGPLTSDALARCLQSLTGSENLAFYDAISPIVDAETLNHDRLFPASRYGKGGGDDYLNCPLNQEEYQAFYDALRSAEKVQAHEFEDLNYFEACLPIEELARRGYDTPRFGPMKPVGLVDPRTGYEPFAVVTARGAAVRRGSAGRSPSRRRAGTRPCRPRGGPRASRPQRARTSRRRPGCPPCAPRGRAGHARRR